MDIEEQVYAALLKSLEEDSQLSWVTPVFVPGHPCFDAWCDMQTACERLRQRLGAAEEDTDMEEMIGCLLRHGKILALEMFRYGRIYRQTQDDITA